MLNNATECSLQSHSAGDVLLHALEKLKPVDVLSAMANIHKRRVRLHNVHVWLCVAALFRSMKTDDLYKSVRTRSIACTPAKTC
jgi:hypothetical protein